MQALMSMHILWLSALVGVLGMGLGGMLSAMLGRKSEKMVSALLALAGGVMIAIVLLELIPESYEYGGAWTAILGLAAGAAMVWLTSVLLDKFTEKRKNIAQNDAHARRNIMLRTGIVMMIALAIHNIPEGMAMGAAEHSADSSLGFILAVMLALHNIPEGMAMATPLISGGLGRIKTVLLTLLTGFTTIIGTLIGLWLGGISDVALAFSLAFAGGAMLYVVFGEMLPHTITTTKSRMPTIVMMAGIVLGFLITLIPH